MKEDCLHEKLLRAAARLEYLSKDGRNDFQNYKYVSEAKVKAAVRAALAAEGLIVRGVTMGVMTNSTPLSAVVTVCVTISDGSQSVSFDGVGGDSDKSGKAVMKATAAAVKYALTTGFLIATGDDPEASKDGKSTAAVDSAGESW